MRKCDKALIKGTEHGCLVLNLKLIHAATVQERFEPSVVTIGFEHTRS